MSDKPNTEYFARKMAIVLRDLSNYNNDELWREVNRIVSGATGLPNAEHLQSEQKKNAELEHKLEEAHKQNNAIAREALKGFRNHLSSRRLPVTIGEAINTYIQEHYPEDK